MQYLKKMYVQLRDARFKVVAMCMVVSFVILVPPCGYSSDPVEADEILTAWCTSNSAHPNLQIRMSYTRENHLFETISVQDALFHCYSDVWNELEIGIENSKLMPAKIEVVRDEKSANYRISTEEPRHWIRGLSSLRGIDHKKRQVDVLNLNDELLPLGRELFRFSDVLFELLRGPKTKYQISTRWKVQVVSHGVEFSKIRLIPNSSSDVPDSIPIAQQIDLTLRSEKGIVKLTELCFSSEGLTQRWKLISRVTAPLKLSERIDVVNKIIAKYPVSVRPNTGF